MTAIPFETQGFPGHVPAVGAFRASQAMLQWAAVTVGVSATSASSGSRPAAELQWRSAMMEASLDAHGGRWVRSVSYTNLDQSEKSAVSYFLGMAQAQLSCAILLSIPTLVHLDTYLRIIGKPTRKSRPDFLGYDPVTGMAVGVEAKGRTHGWTNKVVTDAKAQAALLPGLIGAPTATDVVSVAWFDRTDVWNARLVDPPSQQRATQHPATAVLAAHYLPVIWAVSAVAPSAEDGDRLAFRLDPIDLTVSLPATIVQQLSDHDGDVWAEDRLAGAGEAIAALLLGASELATAHDMDPEVLRGTETSYTGGDLVGVELGVSWLGG